MKVMLDTNICIYIIKQKPRSVLERFAVFPVGDLGISAHASAGSRAMTVAVSIERNKLLMDRVLTER